MEYSDNRGRRIIFVGNCVLNQNVRAFGGAVKSGPFAEFVEILLKHGIGIEQLPCPECLAWGGIGRKSLYKWQVLVFNSIGKWWSPILEFFIKVTTFLTHGRACRQQASRAADWMEDHLKQGFEIVGVVTANDSPTCGVTKTVDLLDVMRRGKALGMTQDDFVNPRLEKMSRFVQSVLVSGAGAFSGAMMKEFRRRRIDIRVVGWDPWQEPQTEAIRIAETLELGLPRPSEHVS